MRSLIFRPRALREIEAASRWYEQQRAGLGKRLEADLDYLFKLIGERPEIYPLVVPSTRRPVRRATLRLFPYCVFYTVNLHAITILRFRHQSREVMNPADA